MDQASQRRFCFSGSLILLLTILLTKTDRVHAQAWVQRADIGYVVPNGMHPRKNATSFVIGDHAFLTCGIDLNHTDRTETWRYDPLTDRWESRLAFAGVARCHAASFTINDIGYVFGGAPYWQQTYFNDLWAYDPVMDEWTPKASLPVTGRSRATGFSMNGKGYICSGYDGSMLSELWEYDPATDSWTQLPDLAGPARRSAVSFVLDNKAYVATGRTSSGDIGDLWEFDPVAGSWSQKASLPIIRSEAVSFTVGGYAYIGSGTVGNSGEGTDDLWRYDPVLDEWSQASAIVGARNGAVAFTLIGKGFVFSGDAPGYPQQFQTTGCSYDHQNDAWTSLRKIGTPRRSSISYVIEGKAYVGGGSNDQWQVVPPSYEYSPTVDEWIERDLGCSMFRIGATSFSIGEKGFGITGSIPDMFGEGMYAFTSCLYDQSMDSSETISLFTGISRTGGVGFAVGEKGYLTCGHTGMVWSPTLLNDLWEYDPMNDAWTQRASLPGPGRVGSAGFVIDDNFFLVGGTIDLDGNNSSETWQYDPITDVWSPRSPIPIASPYPDMIGVAIGSKGYVCAGNSMWMYDPILDMWQPLSVPPYPFNSSSIAFSIGNKGYFGSGNLGPGMEASNVFFEYDPEEDQITTQMHAHHVTDIRIWPNPIGDRIVNISSRDLLDDAEVRIMSLDGRIVFDRSFQSSTGSIEFTLPEEISRGTYLIQFRSKKRSFEQRIVIL